MKILLLFLLMAFEAAAQTNQNTFTAQQIQKIREDCILNRRQVCGKILKILPDGLVVDSGYADLTRSPLNRSWLLPSTVAATRSKNVIEQNQPDSICIGLVFLADLPKGPRNKLKPKLYDYINLEAYATGQYTYTSIGEVRRTVRKFSANLVKAVEYSTQQGSK